MKLFILAPLALLFLQTPVQAQLIFDGGTPLANQSGFEADSGNTGGYTMAGEVFTPSFTAILNTVQLDGFYSNPNSNTTDSFTFSLYSVVSGTPTTLLATSTLASESSYFDPTLNLTVYSGKLATPFVLAVGTPYFVGVSDTTSPFSGWAIASNDTASGALFTYQASTGKFFNYGVGEGIDYELGQNSVPEPSTWALMLGGLGALAFSSRRWFKASA